MNDSGLASNVPLPDSELMAQCTYECSLALNHHFSRRKESVLSGNEVTETGVDLLKG
jgi:hypothetical protein